jgi:hypothetical protein
MIMKKFSPMLVGGILCTVALVGLAAVKHSEQPRIQPTAETESPPRVDEPPLAVHAFMTEGPEGALRIHFSDLDLLKLADVQVITPECVSVIPDSIKALEGQLVRLRGFMKNNLVSTEIPEFVFVKSTEMCCFSPMGRVDHLAAVRLRAGTTTDYIELRPFDVQGRFRIEVRETDDGLVFLLYHLDDAVIIQR